MTELDARRRRRRRAALTGPIVILAGTGVLLLTVVGADPLCYPRSDRCKQVNEFRADHNRPGLEQRHKLQTSADTYAGELADTGVLAHDLRWIARHAGSGEIVGYGGDWAQIMRAWKLSSCRPEISPAIPPEPCPGHREILLDRGFTRLGIGADRDPGGTLWAVIRFR